MYIPKTGERVFVNEHEAIFTVASVYHEAQTADLVPVGRGPVTEDVPWRKLFSRWSSPVEGIDPKSFQRRNALSLGALLAPYNLPIAVEFNGAKTRKTQTGHGYFR